MIRPSSRLISPTVRVWRYRPCRRHQLSSNADGISIKHAEVKAFVLGAFAGGLGSLIGLGGAFIVIPFLNGPMQLNQHMTHGTSMATVVATSIGACANYAYVAWKRKEASASEGVDTASIDFTAATLVAVTAGFAAKRGAIISKAMTGRQLKIAMGLFTLSVAPLVHVKDFLKQMDVDKATGATATVGMPSMHASLHTAITNQLGPVLPTGVVDAAEGGARMLCVGLMSGYLAGVFGVGGGAVTVPALCLLTDMPYRSALLTSLAAMVPTALSGALQHYRQGTMVVRLAWPMGAGALLGAVAGTNLVQLTNEEGLRYAFTGIMATLGTRSLWQAFRMVR